MVCIDEEIPFEIPKGWVWSRLKNISFKITDGTHKTPKYCTEGVKFVSAKDIINGVLNFNNCKYISIEEHQLLFARCNPEEGDLVISKSGSIGSVAEVDVNFEFSLFESLALIKYDPISINHHYLRFSIEAAFEYLSKDSLNISY